MTRPSFGSSSDIPAVFPDWSPYQDLESAARAYLRDPEIALESLSGVLRGAEKYIELPLPELYDLGSDPGEQRNLAAGRPASISPGASGVRS